MCDKGFYPDKYKRYCHKSENTCEGWEIMNLSGKCEECQMFHYPDIKYGRICMSKLCEIGSSILKQRGRCELCPDGQYPDNTKKMRECKPIKCDDYEKMNKDGQCENCPVDHYVD